MHKAKNIYFLFILKKRDGPRQGVVQGRVPSAKDHKIFRNNKAAIGVHFSRYINLKNKVYSLKI